MNDGSGILRPQDREEIGTYIREDGGDYAGLLECLGRIASEGAAEGRFSESDPRNDLEFALLVGFACNNMDDYEHFCTAVDWLSGVEHLASGCGVWYYRYANALLYTGKPRLALEYLLRGVDEEPDYPWCWLTLGRLKAHFGDADGATEAAFRGLELCPADPEFLQLVKDAKGGASLEEMELGPVPGMEEGIFGAGLLAFWSDDPEISRRGEAILGMAADPAGLARAKDAISPTGWIPDHPYCTFIMERGGRRILVTLAMNEAFLSNIPADRVPGVLEALPAMEAAARASIEATEGREVFAVTVDRRMGCTISFGTFGDEQPVIAYFDDEHNLVRPNTVGGPFVAIVLMNGDPFDPEDLKRGLESWGLGSAESFEDGNLVFDVGGHLAAFSLIRGPVPDGEAQENAANNYMWPEAVDVARAHREHMLIALVNHGGFPVDAALIHTRMVAAVCGLPCATGVYFQGTVVSPESYVAEAGGIRDGSYLPIDDWVWIGLYRTEDGGINAYTRGMSVFARDEIEVIGARDDPERIRAFLYDVVSIVLDNDLVLGEDDMIGYEGDRALSVTVSPGVSIDETTVKIEYPGPPEDRPSS
ncbi:MAG: DUF4261 domain-containing protein [Thermoplasmata archaeon]|nr:DUF4261 domain-containing protein [Thermoplasmata archaeon]